MKRLRLSDVAIGTAAGLVGTLAMDTLWWRRSRQAGSELGFVEWEFNTGTDYDSFDDVPAPGQVGQRLACLVGVDIPVASAGLTTDVVHWATGASWGAAAVTITAVSPLAAVPAGIVAGVAAVSTAYGALGAAGIYEPVWAYDSQTLWKDVSAHLVFGTAAGAALWTMPKVRSMLSPLASAAGKAL
ncbi:MAG: hypothetical protein WD990_11625 [Acidimicrobiia bacterium]